MPHEPAFDARHAIHLYASGQHSALSSYFLDILDAFKIADWRQLNPERHQFLNAFLTSFGALFTQEDYRLDEHYVDRFICSNPVIANIAAMSTYGTTDPWLELLRPQKANFVKILTLLNARSRSSFDVAAIFGAEPKRASVWYRTYFELFHCGAPTKSLWENGRQHIENADTRLTYVGSATGDFYFFLSYLALENEQRLKGIYHNLVRPIVRRMHIRNRPNPKSIAIVTARWSRTSAVYKSLAPFVEALRQDYELTLVRLRGAYRVAEDFDKTWFKSIRTVTGSANRLNLGEIAENDFALAYFPDVGMQPEDRHLCDLRIAPIQVMGYGHPVSTHGAQIDYIVGGREVELLDDAKQNYSERLIAIRGLGAFPVLPAARPSQIPVNRSVPLLINCPWSGYKCVYPHLQVLRTIADAAVIPVRFRFFVGQVLSYYNQAVPFASEMEQTIGNGRVEIITELPYSLYQQRLEEGAFSLDSYPFGGYNTIVDSLALGRPVVVLEGRHAVNRLAAALLRRIGLAELIATNAEEYVTLALRLVSDEAYRNSLYERLQTINLETALCRPEEPRSFKRAIDLLVQKGHELQQSPLRDPILID